MVKRDLRNDEAKARDKWLASEEALRCLEPSILSKQSHEEFLRNRLVSAFSAGWDAAWSVERLVGRSTK